MAKGMTNSVIALIGISVLVTALVLSRPFELENEKNPIYSFIEKTDYKKQVVWFMADQAITEAFADHALERTQNTNDCDARSEISPLDTKTEIYIQKINDQPENQECDVALVYSSLVSPEPPNSGLEQYNAAIEVKCKAGMQNEEIFVEIIKSYDFNKLRLDTQNDPCTVAVKDLDSEKTFTQP